MTQQDGLPGEAGMKIALFLPAAADQAGHTHDILHAGIQMALLHLIHVLRGPAENVGFSRHTLTMYYV